MSGYVVTTWHGRNGWGGLKYWLTTPGRYTLAEAIYLNQQDFLHQFNAWAPELTAAPFDYDGYMNAEGTDFDMNSDEMNALREALGGEPTIDQLGFWHDRDVLALYGDPKWDVRLQQIPAENDFTVTTAKKGRTVTVTIETAADFSLERMAGDGFKQEHVLDLPFSCLFPERLANPRLAEGQTRPDGHPWDAVVAEDFMLIYNPAFEPGKTYTVTLVTE
jgi:zinc protease